MSRMATAIAELIGAALSIMTAASAAQAGTHTVSLGYASDSAYGVKTFDFPIAVQPDVNSDATLLVTIIGDFDEGDETLSLKLDGYSLGQIYAGSGGDKCELINFTVVIPKATMKTKAADGQITVTYVTSNKVSSATVGGTPCDYNGETNISAYVSSVLTYQTTSKSSQEIQEDTISTAGSLGRSRRTVTMANLPSLSSRLGRANFNRSSPGGGFPRPAAPPPPPQPAQTPTGSGVGVGGTIGSTGGSGRGGGGGLISGSGNAERGFFSFSGDLSGFRQAAAMSFGQSDASAAGMEVNSGAYPIDIWVGGSYTYFESSSGDVSQTGDIGAIQIGVDSRLSEDLLIGVAAFGDLLASDVSNTTETTGLGFMTGPYFVASLDGPVYLEGLAAVGRAYNRIQAPNSADTRYESDRLLLTTRLSGDWNYDSWTIRPSTRVTYYAERQESFTDSAGSSIPENTSILGQLRFGPEIGYTLDMEDSSARPFLSVEGAWSFLQSDQIVDGVAVQSEDLTGGVGFGLDGRWRDVSFRAGGRYDGLGDKTIDSYSGELTIRMPLD